jgi:hypothetical protein|nr:MAG TPA: hypothetical protein [Bacteriophage sp.]
MFKETPRFVLEAFMIAIIGAIVLCAIAGLQ